MNEPERTTVIIFTKTYRIEGKIAVVPKARVTDFLMVANRFIPVIDTELKDMQNNVLLTADYLSVHRDNIEVVIPFALAQKI